ncbi:MAG: hypothetical protein IKT43_01390 [Clostridia bacterium]|nr:hypothetical protein [Clostridia bacterium]
MKQKWLYVLIIALCLALFCLFKQVFGQEASLMSISRRVTESLLQHEEVRAVFGVEEGESFVV